MERQVDGKIKEIDRLLKEFAGIADMVTVTTPFLVKEYAPFNKNVVVLPNMVDPDDWDKPKRTKGSRVRIGLVGSTIMNKDSLLITPLLRKLGRREDVQLVIFGLPPESEKEVRKYFAHEIAYWNTMNIEWHPAVPIRDYFGTLNDLELDIMLIPRQENYFNKCKSNVKFLEASMLEIPVIAQTFEDAPYNDDQGHLMLLVS